MPDDHDTRTRLTHDSGDSADTAPTTVQGTAPRVKQRRGFAAMDPARQRQIASKGGRASHEAGTGHEWNSEAARAAGRKGGQVSHGGRGRHWGMVPPGGPDKPVT